MTAMGTGAEGWRASTSFTRTPLACVMLMFIQLSSHVFNLDQGIQSLATGAGWQGFCAAVRCRACMFTRLVSGFLHMHKACERI